MDPRDPGSPAFYYTFVDPGRQPRRGGGGLPGCGCGLVLIASVAALVVFIALNLN